MDIVIAVVSTIVFGIFSKALVNIPYMTWGIFDWTFAVTFILWLLYMASLYVAAKIQDSNGERNWKIILKSLIFGTAAALVKMGIDAAVQKIAANQDNMIYAAAIMELEILLFGSAAMLFLYFFAAKKKFTAWKPSLNVYAAVGGSILAVYIAVIYYYLFKIKWAMERFSGAVQEVGTEQAKWNLSVKFARESAVMGMLVYVAFFITLWLGLRKWSEEIEKHNKTYKRGDTI